MPVGVGPKIHNLDPILRLYLCFPRDQRREWVSFPGYMMDPSLCFLGGGPSGPFGSSYGPLMFFSTSRPSGMVVCLSIVWWWHFEMTRFWVLSTWAATASSTNHSVSPCVGPPHPSSLTIPFPCSNSKETSGFVSMTGTGGQVVVVNPLVSFPTVCAWHPERGRLSWGMISCIQKPIAVSLIISRSSCSMVVSLENLLRPNTLKYSCSSCFIILPRFALICLVVRSSRSCFFQSMCLCIVSFHGSSFTTVNIVSFDNTSSSLLSSIWKISSTVRDRSPRCIGLSNALWREPMWTRNSRWSVLQCLGSLMTAPSKCVLTGAHGMLLGDSLKERSIRLCSGVGDLQGFHCLVVRILRSPLLWRVSSEWNWDAFRSWGGFRLLSWSLAYGYRPPKRLPYYVSYPDVIV